VLADHAGAPADLHEVVTRPGDHADLGADVAGLDRVAGAVQAHQAVAVDLARHDQLKPIGRPTHRQQMGPLGGQRLGRRGGDIGGGAGVGDLVQPAAQDTVQLGQGGRVSGRKEPGRHVAERPLDLAPGARPAHHTRHELEAVGGGEVRERRRRLGRAGPEHLSGAVVAHLGRHPGEVVERGHVPGGQVRPALALEELREQQLRAAQLDREQLHLDLNSRPSRGPGERRPVRLGRARAVAHHHRLGRLRAVAGHAVGADTGHMPGQRPVGTGKAELAELPVKDRPGQVRVVLQARHDIRGVGSSSLPAGLRTPGRASGSARYRRTVLRSLPRWRAIADTDQPRSCRLRSSTNSSQHSIASGPPLPVQRSSATRIKEGSLPPG
jgi:hypothetical protein